MRSTGHVWSYKAWCSAVISCFSTALNGAFWSLWFHSVICSLGGPLTTEGQETKMARSGTLLPYLAQREIQSCCFSPQKSVLLQKKCSLQQQNCVQIVFLYFPHYGTMGLLSPFVVLCTCWHRYLVLWYWAVFTNKWSKLNGRKWLPWLVHVIVQTFPVWEIIQR